MRRLALILLALMALVVPATAEAPREALWRTQPGHKAPPSNMPLEQAVAPPLLPLDEYPQSILVRRVKGDMYSLGKMDSTLSEACRAGLFREKKPSKMIAVSSNATLGAAFGYGLGLVDIKKLADPSKVYYFYHASTSACAVRVEDNWDPAHARSR